MGLNVNRCIDENGEKRTMKTGVGSSGSSARRHSAGKAVGKGLNKGNVLHGRHPFAADRGASGKTDGTQTEWDLLSASSREEVDGLVEVLKAVKAGDFTVRFPYQKDGI